MRIHQLLGSASACAFALVGSVAQAQSAPPAAQKPATQVEEVVVTGSLIARRDFQSDSPISTIDSATLQAAGQPTLDVAVGQMPQFAAAQGKSEVGDVQGGGGFAGGQSYGDLRGLGPNRTLILLDGRRLQASNPDGSIDLNTIPMSMIENVEVITGGASATYGSDAIAGVINFKLRRHFSGLELSATHGGATKGDGETNQFSVLVGGNFADNRGNAMIDFEYSERAAVSGASRPFFASIRQLARPPEGIIPAGTFGNPPTIAAVNAVLATYPGTTPIAGTGAYNGAIGVNTDGTIFTDLAGTNCVQNYRGLGTIPGVNISPNCRQVQVALGQYFAIQVPLTKYNVMGRGDYAVTDHINAYGQFNFMESTARDETAGGSTAAGKFFFVPLNNPFVTGNAALQSILASRTPSAATTQPLPLIKLLTMSGNRIQTFKYDVYQVLGGFKGDIPGTGLTWDVYGSFGRDSYDNNQANDTSKAAIASILNGTANFTGATGACIGYAWNPLGNNPLSPGCREYATRELHNTATITQKDFEATIQGKLYDLPAGELRFALGADYRSTNFDYRPDQGLIANDTPSYPTAVPTSGSQTAREVFGELLIPVLKDLPLVEDLSLDLGYRRSDYNLFGASNTYKADVSWKPISTLRLRGGYSTALRAPSVGELFAPTVNGQLTIGTLPDAGDPCSAASKFRAAANANAAKVLALCQAQGIPSALLPTFTQSADSVFGTSGGNPKLTPEKAKTYSVGAVWSPTFDQPLLQNLQVSVDYYNIKIDNAVGTLALTSILPRCFNVDGVSNSTYSNSNIYCQQITRDTRTGDIVLGREGFLNLATYSTDGVDTQVDWSFGLDALGLSETYGRIRVSSVITYTNSYKVASLPGAPVLDYAGSIGNASVSPEIAHPKWKANTTIGYSVGPVSAALHWRFIDKMKHQDLVASPAATTAGVPSYNYFDADVHWSVRDNLILSAGVTNIGDKAPPFVSGQPLTTDTATYDIIGRTYYVNLKAHF
ncbi:TonB-dependent receptor [Phenylobacterium hankyongense]|uniref:TonB-dependent receptor n=1 Tax=Phenylobacterium hankyongense TaxID=1813876 RepID=A0A328B152_9CAUL|nr:TonB-dependent receptor [Phenylobacterium hankyongense]RAK60181.1 TonB-dependent receptor [Phenylobacterium hankyongense]